MKERMVCGFWAFLVVTILFPAFVESVVRRYKFNVVMKNTTRLCATKAIVTVNGKFPGPTLYAREDDNVIVKVTNHVPHNVTIHWHGIRQYRTGWSDGPAYITQCPIQTGQSFVHNFTIRGQRGTLFWHAHITWLRATLYGAIVIFPKLGVPYPFPNPDHEKIIILGEWWKADVESVLKEATTVGLPPNVSDSHTINGYTGPLLGCSSQDAYTLHVESNKTYLLRIVNAAVNDELFFKIANHKLTIVEADASYTKPFQTTTIFLGPGQTATALLAADQPTGNYLIAVTPFMDSPAIAFDNKTASATLLYNRTPPSSHPTLTDIPKSNATPLTFHFTDSLRSLRSDNVPLTVDHSLLFSLAVGLDTCGACAHGQRLVASINNVTFVMPTTSLLHAHYYNVSGVFTDDFPADPPTPFDYTGASPGNSGTMSGTRVYRVGFNSTVQIVLQGTRILSAENHPTHLHGFNFFAVGKGMGNFDPVKDPGNFNLVDPVERNTIGVPSGGWVAIRFRADNPGIWFLHCHLEVHTTWGLKMAFLVDNGKGPNESILPPPSDLPIC